MFSKRSDLVRTPPARIPYEKLTDRILGRKYDMSLTFIGDTRSRTLNRIYRSKDKPANVLSFPLDNAHGEIFLNPRRIAREALSCGENIADYTAFLFIHGLLHLKGHRHGTIMDAQEDEYMRAYKRM